jgi:hypothetical protein
MRIDSAGMPVPDEPAPPRRGPEWWCPLCSAPTWPGVNYADDVIARCCVPCQAVVDDAKAEHARVRRETAS